MRFGTHRIRHQTSFLARARNMRARKRRYKSYFDAYMTEKQVIIGSYIALGEATLVATCREK